MTPEEHKIYHRKKAYESWLRHKEECAAKKKIYYQEHRDEIRAKNPYKPLSPEKREEAKAYHKIYYQEHREELLWKAKLRRCKLGA